MCTQPVELRHVGKRPGCPAISADRHRGRVVASGPADARPALAEEERQQPRSVISDHHPRAHETAERQPERATGARARLRGRDLERPKNDLAFLLAAAAGLGGMEQPDGAALRVREDDWVLLRARRIVRDLGGRAPSLGTGRQGRGADEDVRLALERAGKPRAGERSVRQPLQERRVVLHNGRGQVRLGAPGIDRVDSAVHACRDFIRRHRNPPACDLVSSDGRWRACCQVENTRNSRCTRTE